MVMKKFNIQKNSNRHIQILKDERYLERLSDIDKLEENRIFCKHNLSHFISVARIASIIWQEDGGGNNLKRDIIYAAGLLHDVGRVEEYTKGIPHEEAGAIIAGEILQGSGYEDKEIEMITRAISAHRIKDDNVKEDRDIDYLGQIISRADKLSRECFACNASDMCKWSEEKKNKSLEY